MKITIIGCGNMGKAFAMRLKNHHLFLLDLNIEKMNILAEFGQPCPDIKTAIQSAEVIILAVKPQGFDEVAKSFENEILDGKMLISLLTSVSIKKIREKIPMQKIVRMMPNLPIMQGEGLLGISIDNPLDPIDHDKLLEIAKPLGKMYFLEETKMNAFTSLAGSGPGFLFAIIKSIINAGIELGFSKQESEFLVMQMVKGSVLLLEKSGKGIDELIAQIATPKGTTIAGLNSYEQSDVNKGIISTFLAAYKRANEL